MFLTALFPQTKKVKVTSESTNIYQKPNIKSRIIETVKKETVLNLSKKQKKPRIWNQIYFYSEKRKTYTTGFVKVTAVERIDHIQKKLKDEQKQSKKEEISIVTSPLTKEVVSVQKTKKPKEEFKLEEKLSITFLPTKEAAASQKSKEARRELKDAKLLNTASPTKKATAFQKIIEPPVKIKIKEMPLINPSPTKKAVAFQKITEPPVKIKAKEMPLINSSPTMRIIAFQKIKESPDEIKTQEKLLITSLPTKRALESQKLKKAQEKLKNEKKVFTTASQTKEVKTSQNIIENITPIKKSHKEIEMRPLPVKASDVQKILKAKKVKVTSESANIYQKPNIKSRIIETVKKETVLNLSKKQKKPRIWNQIYFYSEKRKTYTTGFVKITAVERIDHIQKKLKDEQKQLKKEEISIVTSPLTKEVVSVQKTKKPKEEFKLEEKLSIASLATKEAAASQKLKEARQELKDVKLLNTASPTKKTVAFQKITEPPVKIKIKEMPLINSSLTKKAVAFQKITDPPVKIKIKEMPLINPSPTMRIIAFQKIKESPDEIKTQEKLPITSLPTKRALESQKLKKAQEKLKNEEKVFTTTSQTKEVKTSQNIIEKITPIKKSHKEIEMRPLPVKARIYKRKFRLITLGIGYGQSHGGAGGFIQFNTKARLSFHAGVGYFPAYLIYSESDWVRGAMLFSGGLKYYLPLRVHPLNIYLDLQFCGIRVEAAHVFSGAFYNGPLFDNVQKTLWGPSLLGGVEVKMGMIGLNGALGLSYNITEANWLDQNIFLTFDVGLLIYF